MTHLPDWLIAAREASEGHRVSAPNAEIEPTCPRPGEMRTVGPMDDDSSGHARLVYVLEVDGEYGFATVALTTNELDLAIPDDVLVPGDKSGAPFDVLIELGIVAPLWWAQLGPVLGEVALEEVQDDPGLRTAMALRRQDDIRWSFKESELHELQVLAADCARTVIDEPEVAIVPEVDPEAVASCLANSDARIARLLASDGSLRCAPIRGSAALELVQLTSRSLGPDLLEVVLGRVLNESLTSEAPATSPRSRSAVAWAPPRVGSGAERIDELVNARAERRIRTMRLITGAEFWASERRPDYCAARTEHGAVQVLPEEL